jgi:hypothetical protein
MAGSASWNLKLSNTRKSTYLLTNVRGLVDMVTQILGLLLAIPVLLLAVFAVLMLWSCGWLVYQPWTLWRRFQSPTTGRNFTCCFALLTSV